jgi:hypothetical protein
MGSDGGVMIGSVLRVLFGFVLACLVAGLAKVLFVIPPTELVSLPEDKLMDELETVGILALAAATQSAVFASPFALVGVLIGEWQRLRGWLYYALVGMLIAGVGLLAQSISETTGQPTIVNAYALGAFLAAGLLGGIAYWLVAGRRAGRDADDEATGSSGTRPAGGRA